MFPGLSLYPIYTVSSFSVEIESSDLQKECIIWTGEFGDVWKGNLTRNNQKIPVAIKIFNPVSDEKTNDLLRSFCDGKVLSSQRDISTRSYS